MSLTEGVDFIYVDIERGSSSNHVRIIKCLADNSIWYVKQSREGNHHNHTSAIPELFGSVIATHLLGEKYAPFNTVVKLDGVNHIISRAIENFYPLEVKYFKDWFSSREKESLSGTKNALKDHAAYDAFVMKACDISHNFLWHVAVYLLLSIHNKNKNLGYVLEDDTCVFTFLDFQNTHLQTYGCLNTKDASMMNCIDRHILDRMFPLGKSSPNYYIGNQHLTKQELQEDLIKIGFMPLDLFRGLITQKFKASAWYFDEQELDLEKTVEQYVAYLYAMQVGFLQR